MKTLLQKAKEIRPRYKRKTYTKEEIELALAWLKGEVGTMSVEKVKGLRGTSIYSFLACALQSYVMKNKGRL